MSITGLHLLAIALGGAFGGIGRFWVSGVVAHRFGERFPWGTLVVNVTGATLIGVIAGLLFATDMASVRQSSIWLVLVTGVLGSYTTVSSFSVQTLALVRSGERARAAANVAASLSLCLGSAAAAYVLVLWTVRA